jgi:hypothetical protein
MYLKKNSELGIQTNILIGSDITSEYSQKKIIGLLEGILLLYCPPWLGLKSKRRGLLSMNLVETVSFRNWGCLSKIKIKITNDSSLRVLSHQKNYIGNCFIHYPSWSVRYFRYLRLRKQHFQFYFYNHYYEINK